ncbi:hypothetical protein WKI45_28775 [Delftia tsuruhatensis]
MTTAPTPSEKVQRLAITLEIASAVPDMSYVTVPRHVARDASVELSRLQAEIDRLLAQVHKLEMDALDLASENSILKRQEQAELEARKPLPLSDAEIIAAQQALALSRSRIGLPCTRCGTGKYRADCNAYHDFHRCDSCMHVPMWGNYGEEFGAESLIASREIVAEGPVRVTRLHLTDEGRAALTFNATGPLPGIAGGSS